MRKSFLAYVITPILITSLTTVGTSAIARDFTQKPSSYFTANALPDLGTAAVNTFSIEKENAYGDAYMRIIRSSAPIINDPVLDQYISELGHRLVANATGVKTPFYFFLINNEEINAFAFFGGHVGVHSGLFLNADNESQLASVLAHEITHVTQRHLARSLEIQNKTTPATIAGLLGSILLTIAAPQAGIAALATTQALATQTRINFTRLHEKEADRIGMQLMYDSGFNPNAAANFFSKMATRYRFTTKPPQMLLTHPLPESRITEARYRAAQYPNRNIADNLNYQLAKARIQVRFSNLSTSATMTLFNEQLAKQNYAFKDAAKYGKALTFFKLKQFNKADKLISNLLIKNPNNLFYLDFKTDILVEKKEYKKAIALLIRQQQLSPTSVVINMNLANVYIQNNQQDKAIPLLEESILMDSQNTLAYQLLLEAYIKDNNKVMEHYVRGEIMALNADYKSAINQLNIAYQSSNTDTLQQARISARVNQYKLADQALLALK